MQNSNNWWPERLLPTFQTPQHLDAYDLRGASQEVQLSVATLTGLINRSQPQVYLLSRVDDQFWLEEVLTSVPHTLSLLKGEAIFAELLTKYRDKVQGLIIYDPNMKDSINIATMLAGQRDGVIVSPAQAAALQKASYDLPILDNLCNYKWTSRLQAYRWAQENLLSEANPHLIAGCSPDILVTLRPFLVATRTFIYWLDPRNFLPCPSLGWLSERALMQQILKAFPAEVAHLGWFLQEGTGVILTSKAAKPVLATDFFSNLEVWASVQAAQPFSQPPVTGQAQAPQVNKIYLSFTFSEGDNLQYVQERLLHLWKDSKRGSIPIGWAIPPMLQEAAPAMAAYYARTATPNDEFIAGPSGIGYMYPSQWPTAELSAFLQRTGQAMQRMNLSILEVLDSNLLQSITLLLRAVLTGAGMALIDQDRQQRLARELPSFGVRGILSGGGQAKGSWKFINGIPLYQNVGIAKDVAGTVTMIRQAASASTQRPYFLNVYVLAWAMTPSDLQQVVQQLGDEYEVVTPGVLLGMLPEA